LTINIKVLSLRIHGYITYVKYQNNV